ncbi:MAG: alpha/beta fold hydrolase [Carbonactinosporaceae bacterium]
MTAQSRAAPLPTRRDLPVRGTRVNLLAAGSGPPLLYLHGAGDLGTWPPVLSALAEDYTVIRPDHPGFNGSADGEAIDSVHDLAFFYLDLLDAAGLDEPTVIGSSLGGWLAADLATIEPARVKRLVLVGAAGVRAAVPTPDIFTLDPVEVAELTWATEDARAPAVAQAASLEQDPALFERYLRNRITTAHLGWNPYLHDPKLPARLHRVSCPTLLVWGARDRLLPVAYAHRWSELLPDARLEVIEDAGHLPLVEQPEAALAAMQAFLSDGGVAE